MRPIMENIVKESKEFNNSNQLSANNKNVKLSAIRTKVTHIIGNVTVEPVLFAYMLCSAISSMAVQNLNLEKSCRVNLAYGEEVCRNIMNGNITDLDEETKNVQTLVANVVAWKFPLQTAIPAFMALFVGAWSDRTGNRKACMFCPFFGEVICNIGMILATYFFYELPLEVTALMEALPPALTGGWIIMFMGMYSYIADITTEGDRTLRLGIVTIFVTVGTPLGTSISGILTKSLGFYGVFSLLICIHCSSLTFAYFKLKNNSGKRVCDDENLKKDEHSQTSQDTCCGRYLLFNNVVETVQMAFKPRLGHRRLMIFFSFLTYFIMVGPLYGDSQVAYLYARYKFRFDEVEYSLFTTYNVVVGIFGTMFAIGVLSRRMGVHDSMIGMLAGTSRVAACVLLALAGTRALYYWAPVLNAFTPCGLTAVRAFASKLVHPTELGKMNSLIGVFEALTPAVYMPASSALYVATISVLPGAFYLMDAAVTLIAIVLFGLMYVFSTRDVVQYPERKEQFARDNDISTFKCIFVC